MTEPPCEENNLNQTPPAPDFAPLDPMDGRKLGEWRSIYLEPDATKGIRTDAVYLAILLFLIPLLMVILWLDIPKFILGIPEQKYTAITKYGFAWLSGALGGTLFDLKWLYHVVAKRSWHLDRRLWRLFTPHISGGFAFATIALVSSGLLRVFDPKALESLSLVVGIAFLVGHFSDSAIAKLAEVAETLFGASRSKKKSSGNNSENPSQTETFTNY